MECPSFGDSFLLNENPTDFGQDNLMELLDPTPMFLPEVTPENKTDVEELFKLHKPRSTKETRLTSSNNSLDPNYVYADMRAVDDHSEISTYQLRRRYVNALRCTVPARGRIVFDRKLFVSVILYDFFYSEFDLKLLLLIPETGQLVESGTFIESLVHILSVHGDKIIGGHLFDPLRRDVRSRFQWINMFLPYRTTMFPLVRELSQSIQYAKNSPKNLNVFTNKNGFIQKCKIAEVKGYESVPWNFAQNIVSKTPLLYGFDEQKRRCYSDTLNQNGDCICKHFANFWFSKNTKVELRSVCQVIPSTIDDAVVAKLQKGIKAVLANFVRANAKKNTTNSFGLDVIDNTNKCVCVFDPKCARPLTCFWCPCCADIPCACELHTLAYLKNNQKCPLHGQSVQCARVFKV